MLFVDLKSEYEFYKKDIEHNILKVMESGRYFFGDQTEILEEYFTKLTGKRYCIAVKNCTDAIILVLKKVYKKGMTIILPNFGAYPTAVACKNITDKLYYVDVDDSLTIDINKLPNIKDGIIIPVNLFGNNCNMTVISNYAKINNHIVIEDCAQSTGSGSGVFADYSVFSFYPTKPLASMGDGGMICTNENTGIDLRCLAFYGQKSGVIKKVGVNSRMDEFQAAVVNAKIKNYQKKNSIRIKTAKRYREIIKGIIEQGHCVYHQFPIIVKDRKKVIEYFNKTQMPYLIHYPKHVSEMSVLKGINNEVNFRVAENIISIPIHPYLTESEINKILEILNVISKWQN